MRDIVLASSNRGKLSEFRELLAPLGIGVRAQSEFGVRDAVEDGATFVENALIKARHAASDTGLPALADDSGIVVDALDGAPGIRSARYAGAQASDADNVRKLLAAMAHVPDERRACRFVCVLVFLRHANDPVPLIRTGCWDGKLLHEPRGSGGFGYDPVFEVPGRSCSAAELPPHEKNRISHRGQAARDMVADLERVLAAGRIACS